MNSPLLTPPKEPSWFRTAKSNIKTFLSPNKSSIGGEPTSPIRRSKSISRLYDTFRSPSKKACKYVVRRKSFGDIVYEASLQHQRSTKLQPISTNGMLSREPSPIHEESKDCCICTKRPKTPEDYLRELIRSVEMNFSIDNPRSDLIQCDETTGSTNSPQFRVRPPPNTPEIDLLEGKEHTQDFDPEDRERAERREPEYRNLSSGSISVNEYTDPFSSTLGSRYRERATWKDREYRDLCSGRLSLRDYRDHLISGLGPSFWDTVDTGASLLEKPKPFTPLKGAPSEKPNLRHRYLEGSFELRTPSGVSPRRLRRELKQPSVVCPENLNVYKTAFVQSSPNPAIPECVSGDEEYGVHRSNESSEAELSADEIDLKWDSFQSVDKYEADDSNESSEELSADNSFLKWENDSPGSHKSFKQPHLIGSRSVPYFLHSTSNNQSMVVEIGSGSREEDFIDIEQFWRARAAKHFRWKTPKRHAASTIERFIEDIRHVIVGHIRNAIVEDICDAKALKETVERGLTMESKDFWKERVATVKKIDETKSTIDNYVEALQHGKTTRSTIENERFWKEPTATVTQLEKEKSMIDKYVENSQNKLYDIRNAKALEQTAETENTAEILENLEECMRAIAAEDARWNLEECHKILATLDTDDTAAKENRPSHGSIMSCSGTADTASHMENSSIISYLDRLNCTTHESLLYKVPDKTLSNHATTSSSLDGLSDTISLSRSTVGDSGLEERQTMHSNLLFTRSRSEGISDATTLNHSSTSSDSRGLSDATTLNASTAGSSSAIKIRETYSVLGGSADTTCLNRSTISDPGTELPGLTKRESLDRLKVSKDSSEHLATMVYSRQSALERLFEDLNITPMNKVATLPKGGVGALVHVFEARGLMPDLPTRSIAHIGSMKRINTPERSDDTNGRSSRMSSYDTDDSIGFGSPLKRYKRPIFEGMKEHN